MRRRKNIARITPPPPAIVNGQCSNTWAVAMMRRWVAQDAADAAAERMRSTVYASARRGRMARAAVAPVAASRS